MGRCEGAEGFRTVLAAGRFRSGRGVGTRVIGVSPGGLMVVERVVVCTRRLDGAGKVGRGEGEGLEHAGWAGEYHGRLMFPLVRPFVVAMDRSVGIHCTFRYIESREPLGTTPHVGSLCASG